MSIENCASCRFACDIIKGDYLDAQGKPMETFPPGMRMCRRYAPYAVPYFNGKRMTYANTSMTVVKPEFWCGELQQITE